MAKPYGFANQMLYYFQTLLNTEQSVEQYQECFLRMVGEYGHGTKLHSWTLLIPLPNKPLFFKCQQYKSFENTVVKGEIARYAPNYDEKETPGT